MPAIGLLRDHRARLAMIAQGMAPGLARRTRPA
jgi:hypothetical protein